MHTVPGHNVQYIVPLQPLFLWVASESVVVFLCVFFVFIANGVALSQLHATACLLGSMEAAMLAERVQMQLAH